MLHQAAALLLFNEADELSYGEVQQRLNLPEEDVSRLLHRCVCTGREKGGQGWPRLSGFDRGAGWSGHKAWCMWLLLEALQGSKAAAPARRPVLGVQRMKPLVLQRIATSSLTAHCNPCSDPLIVPYSCSPSPLLTVRSNPCAARDPSLSCAKYKILKKDPDSRNLSKTDKFSFNDDFTDRWGC